MTGPKNGRLGPASVPSSISLPNLPVQTCETGLCTSPHTCTWTCRFADQSTSSLGQSKWVVDWYSFVLEASQQLLIGECFNDIYKRKNMASLFLAFAFCSHCGSATRAAIVRKTCYPVESRTPKNIREVLQTEFRFDFRKCSCQISTGPGWSTPEKFEPIFFLFCKTNFLFRFGSIDCEKRTSVGNSPHRTVQEDYREVESLLTTRPISGPLRSQTERLEN